MVAWSKPSCLVAYHELLELVVGFGEDLDSRKSYRPEVSRSEFRVKTGIVYKVCLTTISYVKNDLIGSPDQFHPHFWITTVV